MECFKNHGFENECFEKEGFNYGFTLPFIWFGRRGKIRVCQKMVAVPIIHPLSILLSRAFLFYGLLFWEIGNGIIKLGVFVQRYNTNCRKLMRMFVISSEPKASREIY